MLRMRAGVPILLQAAATVTRGQRVRCRTISPPQELVFEAVLEMAGHLDDLEGGVPAKGERMTRSGVPSVPGYHKIMWW